MAALKDIHPRWQDESVEEEWDLFPQLASDCSTPPDWRVPALSFREETPDSPRTNRGSRCLACLSGIQISWRNFWKERSQSIVFC